MGETRWLILTPGSDSNDHGRGSCLSATLRTFFAALLTAFRNAELTCRSAERISFLEIHTPSRERLKWSSFFVHAKSAASPRLRTSATISAPPDRPLSSSPTPPPTTHFS